jgi:ribonucleoside-diphosphate reductase alpha chain
LKRENVLNGKTYKIRTGCGAMYVTVNVTEEGTPIEIFINLGKAGGCGASQTEALGRLISMLLQKNVSYEEIAKQLGGISCHSPGWDGGAKIASCADAISLVLKTFIKSKNDEKEEKEEIIEQNCEVCPECGGQVLMSEGCMRCISCDYTKCG